MRCLREWALIVCAITEVHQFGRDSQRVHLTLLISHDDHAVSSVACHRDMQLQVVATT